MEGAKNKSLKNLEERMQQLDEHSLRYQILENTKNFKSSWIDLGRALYTVYKDKLYKEWGYTTFDVYTAKEIGIRKQTAMKLLRSYYFLEKEEPALLSKEYAESAEAAKLPTYEAVDVLRTAKAKKVLDQNDYNTLKKDLFEKGKDASAVKKDVTALIRQRQELEPEEVHEKKRFALVRRLVGVVKSLRLEAEEAKLLPAPLLKEVETLLRKLEAELG